MRVWLLLAAVAIQTGSDDWLRFRGPNGTGVASGGASVPIEFGPGKNLIWKADVPFAQSSPVVTRDRVFLTASEGDLLITLAFDPRSGRQLWRRDLQRPRRTPIYRMNDPASPTPASDGQNVFVFFADFGLISYSPGGDERWRLPLGPFDSFYGLGTSPIVDGDTLILVCDQKRDSFVMAVDTRTGGVRWKKPRANPVESFTTPIVHRPTSGPPQVIVFGSATLDAYSLDDGERMWWVSQVGSYPVASPALGGGMVFVSAQGSDSPPFLRFDAAVEKFDRNRDGLLQEAEMKDNPQVGEHFGWMDRNSDGSADRAEYDFIRASYMLGYGLTAVRVGDGRGDVTASGVAWRLKKEYPYMPSPLLHDGVLYTLRNGGIVMSIDPATGAVLKMARLSGAPGVYVSSPVAAAGRLFITSNECKISVVRASAQWEPLAMNDLDDECFATPAIAGGRLFVRTRTALYAFAEGAGKEPIPARGRPRTARASGQAGRAPAVRPFQ